MRVSLALIATTLFSSMAMAAPGFERGNTGTSVSNFETSGINRQVNTELYADRVVAFKRGVDGNTAEEKAQFHTNYILNSLRNYVTDEKIGYVAFENNKNDLLEDLEWTEWLVLEGLTDAFGEKIDYLRRFYDALKDASESKDRFDGCDYTGSNLVEKMMEINLRILRLNDFDETGEPQVEGFENKRSELEDKLTALENTKEEMIPGMQKIFKEQAEIAKTSLKLLKRYDEDEENSTSSTLGKKKDCPAI